MVLRYGTGSGAAQGVARRASAPSMGVEAAAVEPADDRGGAWSDGRGGQPVAAARSPIGHQRHHPARTITHAHAGPPVHEPGHRPPPHASAAPHSRSAPSHLGWRTEPHGQPVKDFLAQGGTERSPWSGSPATPQTSIRTRASGAISITSGEVTSAVSSSPVSDATCVSPPSPLAQTLRHPRLRSRVWLRA